MKLVTIGCVRSGHFEQKGTPIQAAYGEEDARVEIDPPYREALADLDGFERIWLLVWLHDAREFRPKVVPYLDDVERGLFATRSPARPNPIGLSPVLVRSVDVGTGVIETGPVDFLDGTAVLDLKPYVPGFEAHPDSRAGWLDRVDKSRNRADDRFRRPGK